jgi:integral membrane sensor domain MASE1
MPNPAPRWTIAAWAVLYMACALLSWFLDDPESRIVFAWFPAGVAVAAFFTVGRSNWPLLFAALFAAGLAGDTWLGHPPVQSAWVSAVSVASSMTIAWLSQRYARLRDDLHAVLGWIFITFVVSAVAAMLVVAGLGILGEHDFWQMAYIAWMSDVSGILFGVAILMGFLGFRRVEASPTPLAYAVAAIAWLLLAVCAWYVFDTSQPLRADAPWLMALACLPYALATIVTLAGGDRMGSLAILTLSAIVIYFSDEGQGPFFLRGFLPGEPLLLAQAYLIGAAMLQVFVRIVIRGFVQSGAREQAADHSGERFYRLDLASGEIVWDTDGKGADTFAPDTLTAMLDCVHPEDRQALDARLRGAANAAANRPFSFRIATAQGPWITVVDHNRGAIRGAEGTYIIGSWTTP